MIISIPLFLKKGQIILFCLLRLSSIPYECLINLRILYHPLYHTTFSYYFYTNRNTLYSTYNFINTLLQYSLIYYQLSLLLLQCLPITIQSHNTLPFSLPFFALIPQCIPTRIIRVAYDPHHCLPMTASNRRPPVAYTYHKTWLRFLSTAIVLHALEDILFLFLFFFSSPYKVGI